MASEAEAIRAELERRKNSSEEANAIRAELTSRGRDPRILRNPVPSGDDAIDLAGQTRFITSPQQDRIPAGRYPAIEELPFDHPTRIKADQVSEGVDYRRGLPIWQRFKIATSSNVPRLRSERIMSVMSDAFADIPDDMPKFRYDTGTGSFQFLQRDLEDPEKFRWTALDGSGLELGDLGDMVNLGEIGSMVGSVVGAGKGKVFTFGRGGANTQAAVGSGVGGLTGRFGGEGISILTQYMMDGEAPTYEELLDLGWDGAKIEAFATVTGELGAAIMRTASTQSQRVMANQQGKELIDDLDIDVDLANQNIRQARDDLQRVKNVLGREDLVVTEGTAARSTDLIAAENMAFKSASKKAQEEINKLQARSHKATQDYIDAVFGGNEQFMGDRFGTIVRANDVIGSQNAVVMAQNAEGLIQFSPKVNPEKGLKVSPETDVWQVRAAQLDEEIRGQGFGKQLYESAAEEARANGTRLVSDVQVSDDALRVWKSLDGNEAVGELKFNPNVEFNTTTLRWESLDGRPVVEMVEQPSIIDTLLDIGQQTGRNASGRFEKAKEFSRFLRTPTRNELGAVVKEAQQNPLKAQDLREAILKDYERNVSVNGKFSAAAFEEWKGETQRVLDQVFSPEELLMIRQPGGLRHVTQVSRQLNENNLNKMKVILGDSGDLVLKDPSTKTIWNQMKGKDSKTRQRMMTLLDSMDMGDTIRGLHREDMRQKLQQLTKAKNATGFDTWLKDNTDIIRDIHGSAYHNDLKTLSNIMNRRRDAGIVRATTPEANPSMLGLTRVLFGPLSRAQRFLTAARRGQVRAGALSPADLLSDPQAVRELVQLRAFPVSSRRAARFIQDYDLASSFGWPDGEEFDADNPEHRRLVAQMVHTQLEADNAAREQEDESR